MLAPAAPLPPHLHFEPHTLERRCDTFSCGWQSPGLLSQLNSPFEWSLKGSMAAAAGDTLQLAGAWLQLRGPLMPAAAGRIADEPGGMAGKSQEQLMQLHRDRQGARATADLAPTQHTDQQSAQEITQHRRYMLHNGQPTHKATRPCMSRDQQLQVEFRKPTTC